MLSGDRADGLCGSLRGSHGLGGAGNVRDREEGAVGAGGGQGKREGVKHAAAAEAGAAGRLAARAACAQDPRPTPEGRAARRLPGKSARCWAFLDFTQSVLSAAL